MKLTQQQIDAIRENAHNIPLGISAWRLVKQDGSPCDWPAIHGARVGFKGDEHYYICALHRRTGETAYRPLPWSDWEDRCDSVLGLLAQAALEIDMDYIEDILCSTNKADQYANLNKILSHLEADLKS